MTKKHLLDNIKSRMKMRQYSRYWVTMEQVKRIKRKRGKIVMIVMMKRAKVKKMKHLQKTHKMIR